ncbi:MAG TPA: DUF6491 family protein [Pseudomonadales bacterium]|nr:DUF6491 family protein [Pseudomonadales bacterium]
MNKSRIILLAVLALFPVLSANASNKIVTIPFVDHGNIWSWQPVGQNALLIASRDHHWYKATFYGPCLPLDNGTIAVGFVTNPTGTVDKFSSILVGDQQCFFKDLEEVPAPTRKAS